jgi:WD40 repeat protein
MDGKRILTASYDDTARLWDGNGRLLATLEGHTGAVINAVFSSDGSRVLTASNDYTARLWDGDGRLLATLEGHTVVSSAVFSPDGGRILTDSSNLSNLTFIR